MSGVDGGLQFFSVEEAETVEALAARILPGSPDDPGAREAGVVTYIDRALAGPYARWQSAYRAGVRAVNAFAARRHGRPLAALDEAAQDAVLAALERGEVPEFGDDDARDFFTLVWAHTIEGMFSDPVYGGNRDAVGWRLIGFAGAQYGYTAEEMRYGADLATKPIMTLADVRRLARERPELFYRRPGPEPGATVEEQPEMPEAGREPGEPVGPGE